MRSLAVLACVAMASVSTGALARTVPAGTPVIVETLQEVSSKQAKLGDRVPLAVVQDVSVDGRVVIHAGSPAVGTVTAMKKNGHFGKSGKLTITVDSVTAGGRSIALRGDSDTKGGSGTALMAATTALVSPVGLLIHGKSAKVEPHTRITAYTVSTSDIR